MAAQSFPCEKSRGQFPNAIRDEQEYIKFLCGAKLTSAPCSTASGDEGRIAKLEAANKALEKTVQTLTDRIAELEKKFAASVVVVGSGPVPAKAAAAAPAVAAAAPPAKAEDNDDDIDLFGSDDDDDAEAERVKQERVQAYQDKKSKKAAVVAKSNIILDVKPWDDETDMKEMERLVRGVTADGLVWGSAKLVPLAYGIKKLQISCVVEDDKVGTDFLEEEITKFEDLVQSVDIAAFQKI